MYADLHVAEFLARQRAEELARSIELAHRRASGGPRDAADRPTRGPAARPPLVTGAPQGRHATRPAAAH